MPLYEYECDACGHRFEMIQKFSDPLDDTCPKCGGPVHKLMSSPAIQFKGSGFYITDYAKGDKGSAPKSDGGKADRGREGRQAGGDSRSRDKVREERHRPTDERLVDRVDDTLDAEQPARPRRPRRRRAARRRKTNA